VKSEKFNQKSSKNSQEVVESFFEPKKYHLNFAPEFFEN